MKVKLTKWIVAILTIANCSTSWAAKECKVVHTSYKVKISASRYENRSYRKITLGYLRGLERAFAKCFTQGVGLALVKERKELEKRNPPAKKVKASIKIAKRGKKNLEFDDPPDEKSRPLNNWHNPQHRNQKTKTRRLLRPASAALLSLMMPGAGQAINNRPLAGWLFFLGTIGAYGSAGAIAAVSARSGSTTPRTVGAVVLVGIGGIIHISSVIHAAMSK